jgi:hypothetical protein
MRNILRSHWLGFLFLLPFLVMLAVHHARGLSDAFLLVSNQRDRDSQDFNLAMCAVYSVGLGAYVFHALILSYRSMRWLCAKFLVWVIYWSAICLLS